MSAARILAQTYVVLGKPLRALQRLSAVRGMGPAKQGVYLATTMAQTLLMLGRFDDAIRILREARDALPRRGTLQPRGSIEAVLGSVYSQRGDSAKALECLERGRKLLARAGNPATTLAAIDINRATTLTNLEEYARAERLYARSGRAMQLAGRHLFALQAGYNHAYLRFVRGYFHDALDRFRELRPQFKEANDKRHVAMCDLDEAEISLQMNLPSHAAQLAARAAADLKELGISSEVARAEFFQAVAERRLGHTREALHRLKRAERTFRRLKDPMWWGISLHRLAEIDLELGAAGRAASRAAEGARLLRKAGLRERAGYAEVLVGSIALRAGEDREAEQRMNKLLGEIEGLPLPWLRCEIHHTLARVFESRGDRGRAVRHVLRATRLLERNRVAVPPDEYMAAFLTGKAALFQDAARMVLDLGGASAQVRAFELAEQGRGRALLDLLRFERPRSAGGEHGALQREAYRLEREIDGLGTRMPSIERGTSGDDADRRALEAARREERLRACLDRLATQDPRGTRLRRGQPPRFREFTEALGKDETLIEYFLAGNELITFVLAAGRLHVRRRSLDALEFRKLLERTSFQLDRLNLQDQYDDRYAATLVRSAGAVLEELHDLVIAPVRALIRTKRIVIVPHGDLNGVPFHALESGGRPLLLDHEVVQSPSGSVYLHCKSTQVRRTKTSLLLGVPDETAPHIRREITQLAHLLPRNRQFVGKSATEEALRRYGRRARVIHIAAHARFRHDDPMESGVKLADGWLTIPRIAELKLQPELLVLAGCATGRVSVTEGGEVFGLVRGFLQSGAANLLTTLWPVPDRQTTRFMEHFYRALDGGASAALRKAALAMREEQPHPFHWAPFVLMGAGS